MTQPTKIFKVVVRFTNIANEAPTMFPHVIEYDVTNVTDKSYMIKETVAEGTKRSRNLPKEAMEDIVVDTTNLRHATAHVWVFGSTGMYTDRLVAALIESFESVKELADIAITELQHSS